MAAKPLPENPASVEPALGERVPLKSPRRRAPSDVYAGVDLTIAAAVRQAIADNRERMGNLLPVLHAIQNQLGFLPDAIVPVVAHELNITRAEIHGVISFYHHFHTKPPARTLVQLCRAEACQAVGARELEAHARQSLGIGFGETTADGEVALEAVYCLGNCACGPSILIGHDELHARVTPARFDALLARAKAEHA